MKRRKHRRIRRDAAPSPNLDAYRVRFTPHAHGLSWTLTRHGRFASAGEATSEAHAHAQAARAAERHARRNEITYTNLRDAGLDKKALHKTIDADLKAKAKAKLQALRAELARTVADDKARCKAARAVSVAHAKRIQARAARAAAAIRREIARFEARAKTACGTSSAAAKQALDEERRYQASLRRSAQGVKAKAKRPGIKKPRAVAAAESDDEVRGNIDPHLIPLFNRVRRGIVATTRKSRTEAFLEYVEEHPDEVYADMDDATDALIADLERQQRAGRDRTRHRRSRSRLSR